MKLDRQKVLGGRTLLLSSSAVPPGTDAPDAGVEMERLRRGARPSPPGDWPGVSSAWAVDPDGEWCGATSWPAQAGATPGKMPRRSRGTSARVSDCRVSRPLGSRRCALAELCFSAFPSRVVGRFPIAERSPSGRRWGRSFSGRTALNRRTKKNDDTKREAVRQPVT